MNKLKKVNPVLVVATIVVIGIFSLLLITFINKNTDGTDTVSNTTNETSSVFDPKSTGIFVDVFLQGEEDQQADVDYSSLSKAPDTVFAILENANLNTASKEPVQMIMQDAISAEWRLSISWNNAKQITTKDGVTIKPSYIVFWVDDNDQMFLTLDNPGDLDQQSEYVINLGDSDSNGLNLKEMVNWSINK